MLALTYCSMLLLHELCCTGQRYHGHHYDSTVAYVHLTCHPMKWIN